MDDRPKIPEPIKRVVRQECGFGCAICGFPLYDIDHIVEYAIVKEHQAENLVLLCPTHHREKAWMSQKDLKRYKSNPFNKTQASTAPFLMRITGDSIDIYPGNNHYNKIFSDSNLITYPIVVEDRPLISVRKEADMLLLSLLVNDKDDNRILEVVDNEILFSTGVWDAKIEGSRLQLLNCDFGRIIDFSYLAEDRMFVIWDANFHFRGWQVTVEDRFLSFRKNGKLMKQIRGVSIGSINDARFGTIISTEDGRGPDIGFMIGKSPSFDHLVVGIGLFNKLH